MRKSEVIWAIVNATLMGLAVFFGAFIDGDLSETEIIASIGAAALVAINKFREYLTLNHKGQLFKFV